MLFPSVATSPGPFLGFLLVLTAVSIFSFLSIEKPLCAYLRKAYKTSRSPRSIRQPEHAH
jgi:hypothetical protein